MKNIGTNDESVTSDIAYRKIGILFGMHLVDGNSIWSVCLVSPPSFLSQTFCPFTTAKLLSLSMDEFSSTLQLQLSECQPVYSGKYWLNPCQLCQFPPYFIFRYTHFTDGKAVIYFAILPCLFSQLLRISSPISVWKASNWHVISPSLRLSFCRTDFLAPADCSTCSGILAVAKLFCLLLTDDFPWEQLFSHWYKRTFSLLTQIESLEIVRLAAKGYFNGNNRWPQNCLPIRPKHIGRNAMFVISEKDFQLLG